MNAREELERIIRERLSHYAIEEELNIDPSLYVDIEDIAQAILAKLPELGFVRLEDVEMEKEIAEMQEVADDKEASPEIRSNANSYIRGMKKAIASAKPIKMEERKCEQLKKF